MEHKTVSVLPISTPLSVQDIQQLHLYHQSQRLHDLSSMLLISLQGYQPEQIHTSAHIKPSALSSVLLTALSRCHSATMPTFQTLPVELQMLIISYYSPE